MPEQLTMNSHRKKRISALHMFWKRKKKKKKREKKKEKKEYEYLWLKYIYLDA